MAGDRASAAAGRIARGAVAHRRCGVSRTGGRRVLAFKRCLVARSARGCVSNDFETRTAHEAKRGAEEDRKEVEGSGRRAVGWEGRTGRTGRKGWTVEPVKESR